MCMLHILMTACQHALTSFRIVRTFRSCECDSHKFFTRLTIHTFLEALFCMLKQGLRVIDLSSIFNVKLNLLS